MSPQQATGLGVVIAAGSIVVAWFIAWVLWRAFGEDHRPSQMALLGFGGAVLLAAILASLGVFG